MQSRSTGAIRADQVVNESGLECEFTGVYRLGTLIVKCPSSTDFAGVHIRAYTARRSGGYTAESYFCPADGGTFQIQPPAGLEPVGRATITVHPGDDPDEPQNLDLGAVHREDGQAVPAVEFILPVRLTPDQLVPDRSTPVDPIAQAGLARASVAFKDLVADGGLNRIDFKGFGRSLKGGTQITGTIANVHAFSKAVTADDWQTAILSGGTTLLSTGSTAADGLAAATEVLEKALRAGKNADSAKLVKFLGKLGAKLGGPLGLAADVGGFVSTSVTYANGQGGAHGINLAVDGSAVVGSAVALVPGLGPVGFVITVPAILYTAADVFMFKPDMPDEEIRTFKTSALQGVRDVEAFMDHVYASALDCVDARYDLYLDGLRQQGEREDSLDSHEYREAVEGFQTEKERELTQLAALRPELAKAARKATVKKLRTVIDERIAQNRNAILLDRIGPTRGLDLWDFIKGKGWNLDPLVEIDAYWRDFMYHSVRKAVGELNSYSLEEIQDWADRDFDRWPEQPKKKYASWLPFG